MTISNSHRGAGLTERFDTLRAGLADLAIALERRKRLDAADVAMSLHALIGEMRDELAAPEAPPLTTTSGVDPCAP